LQTADLSSPDAFLVSLRSKPNLVSGNFSVLSTEVRQAPLKELIAANGSSPVTQVSPVLPQRLEAEAACAVPTLHLPTKEEGVLIVENQSPTIFPTENVILAKRRLRLAATSLSSAALNLRLLKQQRQPVNAASGSLASVSARLLTRPFPAAGAISSASAKLSPSWSPSAVASLILDADTIAQADGTAVANWISTGSDTSYAAAQATATSQPTLVKNVLNGRAVVRFNGNNLLQVPAFVTGGISLNLVMLVNLAVAGNYPMILIYGNSAVTDWEMRGNGASGLLQFIAQGGATSFASTTNTMVGTWQIMEGTYLSSAPYSCGIYADGTLLGANTGNTATPTSGEFVWIGQRSDGYPITGDVACLMIVTGDLADADRQKIEGWMAHRWGLTASLPPGHPYILSPP
jgi:hypothetical protein